MPHAQYNKGLRMCHAQHVQRLLYWNFVKCFWNGEWDFETNVHVNYDWYAPRYHHEHTAREVMDWFEEAGYPEPKYINAWPYAPPDLKYPVPGFRESFRLGQLLGVIGTRGAPQP